MTSSPTREEVERVSETLLGWLTGPDSGQNDGIVDAVNLLRALLARAEAAERERDDWKRRAEDMHRRVTAAEGSAYNRWMRDQRDAARAEAARLREAHNDLDAWATAEVARLKRLWTYMQEAAADPDADEAMTAAEWLAEFATAEQQTRAALVGEAGHGR